MALRLRPVDAFAFRAPTLGSVAASERRVNLAADDSTALLLGENDADPEAPFGRLEGEPHIRSLQSCEWSPFRQVIAAIEATSWERTARRVGFGIGVLPGEIAPLRTHTRTATS